MLRLQAESGVLVIDVTVFAMQRSIQKIAGIELHPGLGRLHGQHPPAGWFDHPRSLLQHAHLSVEDVIMVISPSQAHLLIIVVDPRSDGGRFVEVQRRSRHRGQFAGGNEPRVDRSIAVCRNHHQVVENVSLPLAGKVEVTVIGQIEDRVLIGGGEVLDFERVRFQRIADP